ncbi:MAG: sigma 54-interacting transcriptional regulator [Peptococcaceae bacterium]|jgi:transcriptional regulator with PAS, ATPase and Fis domain/iron only hydrogenase large subunit-like protein|nr:sigma 54-interacting transcriptional regulator [Peptococcaceae bacterium]MDH7525946.1 sigma 54-interacting transcriptional regulator [Peptococcaceae bacterium]
MIISTKKERCKQCYACVRNCPVKAVKIEKGQAEVIDYRCIECGNCLKVCSQDAKQVLSYKKEVMEMLAGDKPVSLILAPSFASVFDLEKPLRLVSALKALGFRDVWPAALGAQLLVPEYRKLVARSKMTISSSCPAVVSMVEKHFPSLLKHLAPIASPMGATARYIGLNDPGARLVFAGPCVAKIGEIKYYQDMITCALTFKELKRILEERDIDPAALPEGEFSGPVPLDGHLIPLSGGLAKMLRFDLNLLDTDVLVVDGQKECYQALEDISRGKLNARFIDMLMCRGCIDGPASESRKNLYTKKAGIIEYYESIPQEKKIKGQEIIEKIEGLNLAREFSNRQVVLPQPSDGEIKRILAGTGKLSPQDEINCGACGYSSCREKAVAVYQGIAEVEMCLPYLLDKKTKLLEQLDQELHVIEELNRELDGIVETSYDGLCITDGKGIIIKANKAFLHLYGLPENIKGTYAGELEERKLAYPSVTVLVIKEKRPVTIVQKIHTGRNLLVTGTPVFDENGRLSRVLINSRDFEELEKVKNKFENNLRQMESAGKNYGTDSVIAYSLSMARVLETCRKIAKVDSTVLLSGESGVGKDIIARYIHSISNRKDGPWVKVNCGSIPESLIESELFGYEAGAFTGAKREGKVGMFELAHGGTIFLDEIGELPYNLQVKLLQVLQEKRVVRLGGTRPVEIDVRIIAASNRNLEEMVAKEKFRQDLYYRLNVVPIAIPPLRSRRDDINPLVHHFLKLYNTKYGVNKRMSGSAIQLLNGYSWPGNIRELSNLIERLVVTVDQDLIDENSLPSYLKDEAVLHSAEGLPRLADALEMLEKEILVKANQVYGNSYKIAEALGINQSTVVRKLKKYGIK